MPHAASQPNATHRLPSTQIDGAGFPDRVLALTWDDGPDRHTLELARYLRSQRVSATFFVVQAWAPGVSSYPGYGPSVENTGYGRIPVLPELVSLGHRIGNHTLHHVFLAGVDAARAQSELVSEQRALAPFESDELALFRAPGGAWNRAVADEENAAPGLNELVGPIRWDVDRKDWESSIRCDSSAPETECEAWRGGRRLKPKVTAARYLESISKTRHGIVLLHDRVADVGSRYALDVAHALVPALIARGFVFAAPVLGFSPLSERLSASTRSALASTDIQNWTFVDENDDGRADLCTHAPNGWTCLPSIASRDAARDGAPKSMFGAATRVGGRPDLPSSAGSRECALRLGPSARLADVDGDGRSDCCALTQEGVTCALGRGPTFGQPKLWSTDESLRAAPAGSALLFGDLNGDLRADACSYHSGVVACALSTGSSFTSATVWARPGIVRAGGRLALADVNGDARADLCVLERGLVSCGVAP
ncbi:MAG TPA: polysaccharide deacetylase family protein [Polyangiaceae bacterium]|nr:polysaccharide deacetylase family protein [Polyangiaceae bacterium]